MPAGIDLVGSRFGRLVVAEAVPAKPRRSWRCHCDCGKEIVTDTGHLRSGNTKSCGCQSPFRYKHGISGTKLERKYYDMRRRCLSPKAHNYSYYGGRGISICKEWLNDPSAFYSWALANGFSDDLELDRIDSNGNYEPNNCRFVSRKEQMRNTRVALSGVNAQARAAGINEATVSTRLWRGWSLEEALSAPVEIKHRRRIVSSF